MTVAFSIGSAPLPLVTDTCINPVPINYLPNRKVNTCVMYPMRYGGDGSFARFAFIRQQKLKLL
jgi:hypothetical protein